MVRSGFTYIEIIISIALLVVIGMIFAPFTLRQISNSNLEYATQMVVSNLFTTQQHSFTNTDNLIHAIQFNESNLIIFAGQTENTLIAIDQIDIENVKLGTSGLLQNNMNTLPFYKNSLTPKFEAQIYIYDEISRYEIQINQQGMIDYFKQ